MRCRGPVVWNSLDSEVRNIDGEVDLSRPKGSEI